ncbi:MAG: [protein-PII] uridylyltransferase [Deltaproteobacteria bacterium]|nr:[protein-PII] uridylyltransferase [Deltaproteobacteria bacterium]
MASVQPFAYELPVLPPVQAAGAELGAVARTYVAELRTRLYEQHRAGAGGSAIVEAYTGGIDRLIAFLFDSATAEYTERYVLLDHRCTVAAQGGYGRFELNPSSDIDLLVLFPWRVNAYVETVAERILYSLWDAGLMVGHASRTVADCTRLAQKDLKVKTALLDARFLCGDPPLYAEFEAAMESEVLKKNAARFYREKLAESAERHRRHGDSVYLLEPELKEGAGGLRDIHTAMWLAKVKYKVRDMRELVVKGVISERERGEIEASQDFLFRVRNSLHFLTGSHQDHLTFELQDRAASDLGFGSDGTNRPVERLMKSYFTHATAIRRFSDAIIERCTERPTPYRLIGRVIGREIREGVWIINRTLSVDGAAVIRQDPTTLVTIFRDAQRHGVKITQGTQRLIREHLHLIGEEQRVDPAFIRPFLDILAWNQHVWETLQEMHRVGVVCQLFSEFARIDCLVQRDPNHIYTVDEHSLRGIGELERLRRGEHKKTAPLLTEVMRDIDRHEVLFLALLFHDIGKGHGEGHSGRGADMVRDIAARLPLNQDEVAQWEFLVRQHLLMSHLAQHRDTQDPRLLAEFAAVCGSVENLKMLYVMTFADMRAVGPKVWNNWRDMLLGELYMRTLTRFEQGQVEDEDEHGRAERIRQRLLGLVEPDRRAGFQSFLAGMPERYLTTTPESQVPAHFELMSHLREEWTIRPAAEHPHLFVSTVRHVPESEYSELTICTPDRPGLFSMIAGVLTAQGMNIVGARITTTRGGVAIDSFRIGHQEHLERVLEPERWERVQQMLARVLRGQIDIAALVAASSRPSILEKATRANTTPPEIIVDNDIAEDYTVLDVVTGDRVGVLFAITHALHRLGLVIHLAKITTQAHQVLDVFYVTDGDGRKIVDPDRLRSVCDTIAVELRALNGVAHP